MALIQCPECGKTISDRAKKCPQCGFPVEAMSKIESQTSISCSECVEVIDTDMGTTPNCGCPIVEEDNMPFDNVFEKSVEDDVLKQKKKRGWAIGGTVAIAILLIACTLFFLRSKTKRIVSTKLDTIETDNEQNNDDFVITEGFTNNINLLELVDRNKLCNFSEGLAAFEKDGEWGYVDRNGIVVIPINYLDAGPFKDGLARVRRNDDNVEIEYGYIDKNGKVVVPFEYLVAGDFSEGLTYVYKDGKFGYIDIKGDVVIPFQFDKAKSFSEGLAAVEKNGKYGFVDKEGDVVIQFIYEDAGFFSEGLAAVEKDGKTGFINRVGDLVIPFDFEFARYFTEGLAAVYKDEKFGYINTKGNMVIPFLYEDAGFFSEGLAAVEKDGKTGFINKVGDVVIPFNYYRANPFSEGLAAVQSDILGKIGFIDKKGDVVIPFQYEIYGNTYGYLGKYMQRGDAVIFSDGLAAVNNNGIWGYVDRHGSSTILKNSVQRHKEVIPVERQKQSCQSNDINDMSWLYGSWRLETGGFIFWVYITESNLKWTAISRTGIPDVLWDGSYTLYMNRIEFCGSKKFIVDLDKRKIYSLKGEAFKKQ